MLLHSILGVGTNYFPMKAEQMPKLAALTTADEFAHAAAFPSVLRLLLARELLPALRSACARGGAAGVSSLKFHRVIDNAPIEFDAAQLFAQLNYQLIHLLDFLPVHDWRANADDLFLEAREAPRARAARTRRRVKRTPLRARARADLCRPARLPARRRQARGARRLRQPGARVARRRRAHLARRLDPVDAPLAHQAEDRHQAGAPLLRADRAQPRVRAGLIEKAPRGRKTRRGSGLDGRVWSPRERAMTKKTFGVM